MSPTIMIGLIVVLPVVLLLLLRVNAALVFLSLCLGSVLVQFVAPDTNSFTTLFSAHGIHVANYGNNTVNLTLLLLPAVLTTLFMVRSVKGRSRQVLNILPAAGVGLLSALLVVPFLSAGTRYAIYGSSIWQQVERAQVLIVGGSAVVCLLFIWLQRVKSGSGEGKHSKHHKS